MPLRDHNAANRLFLEQLDRLRANIELLAVQQGAPLYAFGNEEEQSSGEKSNDYTAVHAPPTELGQQELADTMKRWTPRYF